MGVGWLTRGEYVSFHGPVIGGRVAGLVREAWSTADSTYVRLYSYAAREERVYRIEGDVAYTDHRATHGAPPSSEPEPHLTDEPLATPDEPAPRVQPMWLLGAAALAILLGTLVSSGVSTIRASRMSYAGFLSTDMSLSELVGTVSARVSYERDIEDYWSPPADVWESRHGDCEDYAMVLSQYLTHHDIEHDLLSFSLQDELRGHAAVIAHVDGARVLLDPTRATAPGGIQYFRAGDDGRAPSTAEILDEYAVLPATSYHTPARSGQPVVRGYVE